MRYLNLTFIHNTGDRSVSDEDEVDDNYEDVEDYEDYEDDDNYEDDGDYDNEGESQWLKNQAEEDALLDYCVLQILNRKNSCVAADWWQMHSS